MACQIHMVFIVKSLFPECVARVPLSLWGVWGFESVFSRRCVYVRNRPQPSATVRNRSRSLVSHGKRGTLWHSNMFHNVSKAFKSRILLHRFQKMSCSFRGRRSTLATSIVISRGRRITLDVSRRVFFTNRSVMAASSGDTVQIAWQARCAETWRKPRTKHRFWGRKYWGS